MPPRVGQELCQPLLVTSNNDTEILVVQFVAGGRKCRILNGYGPQEYDDIIKKSLFWEAIEAEIIDAKEEGCLIIVQLDANAKVGPEIVTGDPNPVSENGKILLDLVKRQGLYIANSDPRCKGTITWEKTSNNKTERSVIDYFLLCDTMKAFMEEMTVDDLREMTLRHSSKKKKDSD